MIKSNKNFVVILQKTLITIALISGLTLTVMGLSDFGWPWPLPWDGKDALLRYLIFLVVTAIFLICVSKWLGQNISLALGIAVLILAICASALWPMLVVLWFFTASTIVGFWLLKKINIETENRLDCFLIGAGIYGTVAGLFAHLPVNYPGLYGLALAVPLIFGRDLLKHWLKEVTQWSKQTKQRVNISEYCLNIAISVVALIHIVVAFMPELGHDALAIHLFIPAHLLARHQWGFDVGTYVWATMPALGDWIFSIAYMLGGETAARLINVTFIFVLAWLVRNLVLWAGGSLFGARCAILIFLSSPLTFTESNSLLIESIWASFAVAATLAVFKACLNNENNHNQLTITCVLLGFALAAKAVTFTLLPVLLATLIWQYKTCIKVSAVKPLILGLIAFLLLGCIPYFTAWWLTGNPVFPFFNETFHSPFWPSTNFEDSRWSKGLTWDFIYTATFQTGKYLEATPGGAGFQWLLVFLPAIGVLVATLHRRGIVLVIFAVLSITLCFHSTAYLRYIFPAYIVLIAAIGVGMTMISKISMMQTKVLYGFGIMAVILNIIFLSAGDFVYRDFPIKSICSEINKKEYIAQRLPIRNAVQLVNVLNVHNTPVVVFGSPQTAGLTADSLNTNWHGHLWLDAFMAVKTTQDVVDIFVKNHIDFIIADIPESKMLVQRALLDKVTIKIAQFDSISILKINHDFLFKKELLQNPTFNTIDGWVLNGGAHFEANRNSIIVSEVAPATQSVEINPGRLYKNKVVARCYKENIQGRVQVNWHDSSGRMIRPDIRVFTCTSDWQETTMEVTAPINAASALIYASGHTSVPLEFKSVSFK
jgi:hypothetical protein